ncbi:MAG: zf-HC2 domain-containing protein [Clostridia bacterium]|nr:zf-HC2 domain-containing protein [Clostridia bacterium]
MKSCEECQALIDAYLDNELTREQKQRFQAHISSCNECREALSFAESVKATLAALPQIEVPDTFTQSVRQKLAAEGGKRKGIGTYARRYGTLAACVILAVVIAQGVYAPDFTKSGDTAYDFSTESTVPETNVIISEQSAGDEITAPTKDNGAKTAPQKIVKNTETPKPTPTPSAPTPTPLSTQNPAVSEPEQTAVSEATAVSETVIAEPAEETTADFAAYNTDDGLSTAALTDEEPKQRAVSGGGGGGSSKKAAAETIMLYVAVDVLDNARTIASEYAEMADGIYTADSDSFNALLAAFENNNISFTQSGEIITADVSFILTVE